MDKIIRRAFTTNYADITNQLITNATIIAGTSQFDTNRALWDTGATLTAISSAAVKSLNLIPSGYMDIHTPSGQKTVGTYLASILLPNNVLVRDVMVCNSDIGNQSLDLLIGMNIITLGDFAITYKHGHTCFSFSMPPSNHIDFANDIRISNLIGQPHGKGKRKRR